MSEKKLSDEIQAMATIESVLTPLEEEARGRVLRWARERYKPVSVGVTLPESDADDHPEDSSGSGDALLTRKTPSSATGKFETFAEFYSACEPNTDADRVLVASYWATVAEGEAEVESRSLNTALRDMGHGVNHMPSAFVTLLARRPQPVVQTRKTGKTKQATKRYKLTTEGRRAVERMLRDETDK